VTIEALIDARTNALYPMLSLAICKDGRLSLKGDGDDEVKLLVQRHNSLSDQVLHQNQLYPVFQNHQLQANQRLISETSYQHLLGRNLAIFSIPIG
jgi:hypothetical protein